MNTLALVMMISVNVIVISVCAYFFIKVLTSKPKAEPDSYSENDDVPR